MLSGRDAFAQIQSALTSVRSEENQLSAALNSAMADAARLRTRETESWRALARLRLDALARDEVVRTLDASERAALEILERRKAEQKNEAERREELTRQIRETTETHNHANHAVESAADAVDQKRALTQARLRQDRQWEELALAVTKARDTAKAADEKARNSEADKGDKKKPYEADTLFMYLWGRHYGTAQYSAGFFVRFFDAKVANLIDYDELRPNYYMLNEIPARLREHADRLADDVRPAIARLEAFERDALKADGIDVLEEALAVAEARARNVEAQLNREEAELRELENRASAVPRAGIDPDMKRAQDIIGEALAHEDLRTLHREALQTPTPEDDRIVMQLKELKRNIDRADRETEDIRKTIMETERKRAELEQTQERFRNRGYEGPFGGFSNGDMIGSVIGGILAGALHGFDLDKVLDDGFRRRQPRTRGDFGGGIRTPDGDSWPRSEKMGGRWSDSIFSGGSIFDDKGAAGDLWDSSGLGDLFKKGDDDFGTGGGF